MFSLYIPKSALKSMKKIPLPWSFRIWQVINRLHHEPYLGEKMTGDMEDKRKIKVWPYRIIYEIEENIKLIKIKEIEHRGNTSYS